MSEPADDRRYAEQDPVVSHNWIGHHRVDCERAPVSITDRSRGRLPPSCRRRHRVPVGGESRSEGLARRAVPAVRGRPPRCNGSSARSAAARSGRNSRDAGHDSALASQVGGPEWTHQAAGCCRVGLQAHLRVLIIGITTENPTWGYTRIQGALKNFDHRVGRSTIARILRFGGCCTPVAR
jgi:hypothetical protein